MSMKFLTKNILDLGSGIRVLDPFAPIFQKFWVDVGVVYCIFEFEFRFCT